ncbi:MAG: hypothetical protein JW789_01105 [Candidatus Aenigmarchaeota archaeon]|nr:hypothetical protein [Candidatus Aenigmarchaeota archaeon]
MKKGFFHMAEVIIVSILVFAILSQFYNIPKPKPEWSSTKLGMTAYDLISSMEEKGMDWFDFTEVNHTLYSALPRNIGYDVSIGAYVRPVTYVGCVCNPQNFTFLKNYVLDNYTFNDVFREVNVVRIDPAAFGSLTADDLSDYDVLLFWGLPPSVNVAELEDYFSTGRGAVLFSNLTAVDIGSNPWIETLFNVKWSVSTYTSGPSDFMYFSPTDRGDVLAKIFGEGGSFNPGVLGDFSGGTVYPDDGNVKKVLVALDNNYESGDDSGKHVPLTIIDWAVMGNGRTAWMPEANISLGSIQTAARRQLLKTVILWSAAERDYSLIGTILAQSSSASIRKSYNTDFYEPVRIELTVGNFF